VAYRFLSEIDACAGTVHVLEAGGLRLAAAKNIPDVVQQAVRWVLGNELRELLHRARSLPSVLSV
jgi:hypothetical protein